MKTTIFKISILFAILGFSSCGIDEQQTKPDYTLAGKQMFDKTEANVTMVTEWLDILFKINTYIQANEINRPLIEDKYFTDYKIRNSAINTWSIIQKADTVCKIYVDGNPFTTPGSKWRIKNNDMVLPCLFTCKSANNWLINVSNFAINKSYYNSDYQSYSNATTVATFMTDSLNFSSETATPEEFVANNFQVSGKGEFLLSNNKQKVLISFIIPQNLKHEANSVFNMNSGKYTISAEDLETHEKGTSNADFETTLGNNKKVTIVYDGRTQTYTNNNQAIILN